MIKPQTLRGFRDFLPETMQAREKLIDTARSVYRSFGFRPIDTPALEYSEILLGKGGDESDKQLFRFIDQGDRDVAMRFDLTVPFARYAAQHIQGIGTPFKRYHVGTVWRGERPARGRFREFMQCDFDTIGTESNAADIETLLVINELIQSLGIDRFSIRINHRKLLNGLLTSLELNEHSTAVLRALDKLAKIGRDGVTEEMSRTAGMSAAQVDKVLALTELQGTPAEILRQSEQLLEGNEEGQTGITNLQELLTTCQAVGLPDGRVQLDLSIARGLDYYTGTIFETFLDDLPEIGSVCSGGRYDNLAELFTKQKLPGVGASLGVDRLLAALEELNVLDLNAESTPVLITQFSPDKQDRYFCISHLLRHNGIANELYPEAKAIGKQMKYANKRDFRIVLIAGDDEFERNEWQLKILDSGEQLAVSESDVVEKLKELLA